VACDRIEGILQSIFYTQETARPTECLPPDSGRIPSYYQDSDGEVEGALPQPAIYSYLNNSQQANDWGALSRTSLYLLFLSYSFFPTETMTDHRARTLSDLLPMALATGFSEVEPEIEPLKVQWFFNSGHVNLLTEYSES
jgi:hypothetical protein